MKRTLVKKQYLGVGYINQFKNNISNEIISVPITKEEYELLGTNDASNPTLEGHTWISAQGGTVKVDNIDTRLQEDEYCEFEGGYYICSKDNKNRLIYKLVQLDDIINDEIDTNKINIWQ